MSRYGVIDLPVFQKLYGDRFRAAGYVAAVVPDLQDLPRDGLRRRLGDVLARVLRRDGEVILPCVGRHVCHGQLNKKRFGRIIVFPGRKRLSVHQIQARQKRFLPILEGECAIRTGFPAVERLEPVAQDIACQRFGKRFPAVAVQIVQPDGIRREFVSQRQLAILLCFQDFVNLQKFTKSFLCSL